MKKYILLLAISVGMMTPAQAQQTYEIEGPVVEHMKSAVAAYLAQNWDAYTAGFSESAQIYSNTTEPVSVADNVASHQQAYGLVENVDFGSPIYMSLTSPDGQTWGMMWGTWTGTVKGSGEVLMIPVHVSSRFEDGKVVEEHGFWDNGPLNAIAAAMQ